MAFKGALLQVTKGKSPVSSCSFLFCICRNNWPQEKRPFFWRNKYVLSVLLTYHINYQLLEKLLKLLAHLALLLQSRKQHSKRRVSFWSSSALPHTVIWDKGSARWVWVLWLRQPPIGGMFMESRLGCTNKSSHQGFEGNIEWIPFTLGRSCTLDISWSYRDPSLTQ